MPRWVKAFIAVGVAVAVLVAILLLFGGADHGPGRHFDGQSAGSVADEGRARLGPDMRSGARAIHMEVTSLRAEIPSEPGTATGPGPAGAAAW